MTVLDTHKSLPTLGPFGYLSPWHLKARASLRCPPWAFGVASTPKERCATDEVPSSLTREEKKSKKRKRNSERKKAQALAGGSSGVDLEE